MISLCFRKIPSPPPPSRCVRMNQRSQSTQGVSRPVWGPQDVIPTSTALLASSVPARHLAIHPRLSLGSGKAAGCRLCSVRPPVLGLSICLTPPAIALITPFPQHAGRHSLLRAFAPAVLAVQDALSHMSAWLTPSPPSGFCKNVIFSGRPFLIALFTAPQHTACHHPALPFSKVPATIRHAVCLTEVTVQCFPLPSKRKAL